jgi:hypothetical protein
MATRKQNDLETPRTYLRAALQAPTALSTRQKMTSGKVRSDQGRWLAVPVFAEGYSVTRINSRTIRPIARPLSPPPRDSPRPLLPNSTSRRIGINSPPAVPAVVLTEETIMVSSFANNRTLADIYLDARHLLFIFSSRSLHVSSSCFLHVFRVRYAGTENFASARAAAGRLCGLCSGPASAAGGPVPLAGGCWISLCSRRADV